MSVRRAGRLLAALALAAVAWTVPAAPATALDTDDPGSVHQWALELVGAEAGWQAGGGARTVIAVVDSGVDLAHEDLASRLVAGRDFVDGDATPQDCNGHGSHVAGIAAADTGNGRGVASVAPAARIMPVRVLDCDGFGSGSTLADGIRFAADQGAHVINVSVGDVGTQAVLGPSFAEAVRYAWSKGSIPVVAAGNDFVTGSGFRDEPALVVSATTRSDTKPAYSSGVGDAQWGVAAPGGAGNPLTTHDDRLREDVLSAWWEEGQRDQYATAAGTSMAAPHVAGAAAVLRALGLSPQETVDRLLSTALDIGASGPDSTFGYGRLDVARAVAGVAAGEAGTGTPEPPPPNRPSGNAAPAASQPLAAPPAPTESTTVAATATTAPAPTRAGAPPPGGAADAPDGGSPERAAGPAGRADPLRPGEDDDDAGDARALLATIAAAMAAAVAAATWWRWDARDQLMPRSSSSRSAP